MLLLYTVSCIPCLLTSWSVSWSYWSLGWWANVDTEFNLEQQSYRKSWVSFPSTRSALCGDPHSFLSLGKRLECIKGRNRKELKAKKWDGVLWFCVCLFKHPKRTKTKAAWEENINIHWHLWSGKKKKTPRKVYLLNRRQNEQKQVKIKNQRKVENSNKVRQ